MKERKKELFSIPNMLGYFRILMLPVFLICYYRAKTREEFTITFVILGLIFLSDALDGFIARRFNMITNFGKNFGSSGGQIGSGNTCPCGCAQTSMDESVFYCVFGQRNLYGGHDVGARCDTGTRFVTFICA